MDGSRTLFQAKTIVSHDTLPVAKVRLSGSYNEPCGYDSMLDYLASGHKQDEESGLTHMWARYYEGTSGRFISEDPDAAHLNWYVYCGNVPFLRIDASARYFTFDAFLQQIESMLSKAMEAMFIACATALIKIAAKAGVTFAAELAFWVGAGLTAAGEANLDAGAAMLEEASGMGWGGWPSGMAAFAQMTFGVGEVVAGFAMEQLGLLLELSDTFIDALPGGS